MQNSKKRTLSSEMWILLALFVLAGMNFKAKFFYFVIAALLVHILYHRKIRVDRSIIAYVLFTGVYAVYALDYGIMNVIRKFAFIGCYIVGFNTILNFDHFGRDALAHRQKWLKYCVLAFSVGAWLHLMLNFYINFGGTGNRNTIDIWTGKMMAATGQAALAVLMLACGVVLFFVAKSRSERVLGAVSLLSIILYNFILGGRTIILLCMILMVVCLGFVIFSKQIMPKEKYKIFLILSIFLLCITLVLAFDIAGIRSSLMESNLVERFAEAESVDELMEDSRSDRRMNFLKHMPEYPFGGFHMHEQFGSAHDLLLDAYDECGVFMLVALIAILWNAIRDVFVLLRSRKVDYQIKCLILCVSLVIMIEFCLEPIFAGMPWLFAGFALFSGCVRGVVYSNV